MSDFNRPWGILAVRRDTMDYSQTLDFSSFYLLGSSGGVWGDDYSNYVDYVVHNKDLVLALFECSVRVGAAGGALDGQGCGDVVSFVVQTAFLCKDVLRSASAPRLVGYRSLGLGIP